MLWIEEVEFYNSALNVERKRDTYICRERETETERGEKRKKERENYLWLVWNFEYMLLTFYNRDVISRVLSIEFFWNFASGQTKIYYSAIKL